MIESGDDDGLKALPGMAGQSRLLQSGNDPTHLEPSHAFQLALRRRMFVIGTGTADSLLVQGAGTYLLDRHAC